jgi:hypothetical protein
MDVIDALEGDLEVPVVTSDQAASWKLLKYAGIKDKNRWLWETVVSILMDNLSRTGDQWKSHLGKP